MPHQNKTLIMKFGGAAVKAPENFSNLSDLVIKKKKDYPRIVVVVSAMGGMTDYLVELAFKVNPAPPRREYDMLVSVGERISISLLAMALAAKGMKAVSFTGSQSGVITTEAHSDARIISIQPDRLLPHLAKEEVVIVAGFQGVSSKKEITTLGRGGSDTSAVALGVALKAQKVEFYKDVEGVFAKDPIQHPNAHLFEAMDYDQALNVVMQTGGRLLHPRAIDLAKKNALPLHIRSFLKTTSEGTLISTPFQKPAGLLYEE